MVRWQVTHIQYSILNRVVVKTAETKNTSWPRLECRVWEVDTEPRTRPRQSEAESRPDKDQTNQTKPDSDRWLNCQPIVSRHSPFLVQASATVACPSHSFKKNKKVRLQMKSLWFLKQNLTNYLRSSDSSSHCLREEVGSVPKSKKVMLLAAVETFYIDSLP